MEQKTQTKIPREWKRYADKVVQYLSVGKDIRRKIREDLYESLDERSQMGDESNPEAILGNPRDIAMEFAENMNLDPEYLGNVNEYRSETEIFGVPLIHIVRNNYAAGCGNRKMIAKGVIAIGPVAVGIFAIGGLAFGLLSFAGVGIGLLGAFAGISVGGLASLGGISISYFLALGGLSVAHDFAIGGLAVAKHVAIGGQAIAYIAGFEESSPVLSAWSKYAFHLPEQKDLLIQVMNRELDGMAEWIRNIIIFFVKSVV